MNLFIRFKTKIVLLGIVAIHAPGCSSVHREAERIHWSRHPMHDTRIADQSHAGYVRCGVWRIRGARNTVYLAGTSHLVATNQIPFPSPFYAAYQKARVIYVEADTQSPLTTLRLIPKMIKWVKAHRTDLICPPDRTLADYLAPETLTELSAHFGRNMRRERMTPLWLLFTTQMDTGSSPGGENGGVEDVFTLAARRDGKPIRALDDNSIGDTAIAVLDEIVAKWKRDIAENGADAVVRDEILQADELEDAVWRNGDLEAAGSLVADLKTETPDLYKKLLPDRNRKWMVKLKAILEGKRNAFVLVGVAHLSGSEGLIQLLREAGFTVEQMYGVDLPSGRREKRAP